MARAFVATVSSLTVAAAALTAAPFTMACWYQVTSTGTPQNLVTLSSGAIQNRFLLQHTGGNRITAFAVAGGSASGATTTTGTSADTWTHACGVFAANNDRRAFINGGSKGTNTTTRTPAGINAFAIAENGAGVKEVTGRVAEVAIWNVALSDAEVAVLSGGLPHILMRPDALVRYWPLWGRHDPEIQLVGGTDSLTLNGSPAAANHAPVAIRTKGRFYPVDHSALGFALLHSPLMLVNLGRMMRK